ncbi:cytochrome c [Vibrio sp. 404]|uniref:Cytochrome c n=1 Tax=Vibrio marinisediminis TaxID=2758441 RepID=A0A7W2ISJ0_9VIBR|nr:cytochrome c [Vibrio marinisediminis]MBA5761364.1 cytochrome c [Vibrio marinisediminis]
MKRAVGFIIVGSILAVAASGYAIAGDSEAGKAKAVTCTACHGANGISPTELYPNLAGQKKGYLVKQIKAFKDGSRKDPTMNAMVAALTDQDIEDISAFYSKL